ncbi:MAG: nucleotidyltransferase family protein [Blautia sp.]|nr:nucleotidyltransferase family protein [Lachnoclostridium sp.]MCM1211643.1 nucleotidyltransferase family protein [Blautia sp.]
MIEYFSYKDDYDIDFFDPSDYLSEEEYERIHKIEQKNITENFAKIMVQLSKTIPDEQLEKMSSKELLDIIINQSREELASKKIKYDEEKKNKKSFSP